MRGASPFCFLCGEKEFASDMENSAKLLNLFMEYGIVYRKFGEREDGRVGFRCSAYASIMLLRLCAQRGIAVETVAFRGLPAILYRYRRRAGLLVGAVIAAMLITVYDDFVWDIEVIGNESVTYSYVVDALEKQGLSVGTRIEGLNVDRIKTSVMVNSDRISWMAINIEGTVAHVQIREAETAPNETPRKPANVVAAMDGQIERVEVFRGEAAVISGQAVRRGDVLISGVRDLKSGGFSVTRANGNVFAVTERTLTVEIPYEYEQKHYQKVQKNEISVIFFGKEIKILKNNGNEGVFCDTIESVDMISLPGGVRLPVGIKRVENHYYTVTKETYSRDEALELAYYRLGQRLASELPEAQIIGKRIETEIGERALSLICTVRCVENIAMTVEFEAELYQVGDGQLP